MKSITSLILTLVFATNILAFTHNNDTNIHQKIEGNIVISDTVKKTYQLEKFTQSCCTGIVEYSLSRYGNNRYTKLKIDYFISQLGTHFLSN